MSLILEALKKSEAERRLGQTPGLSTLPVWRPETRRSRAWWLLVPALAIAAAALWSNRDLLDGDPASEEKVLAENSAPNAAIASAESKRSESKLEAPPKPDSLEKQPPPENFETQKEKQAAAVALSDTPMPEPQALPQSMDDLEAMKGISPENQRRIRSGELFVPSPSLLAESGPTKEEPIITAESALPPLLPEPGMAPVEAAASAAAPVSELASPSIPAKPAQAAATPAVVEPPAAAIASPRSEPLASSPESRSGGVPSIYDLTLSQRQGLPALKMSMHVYHRDAARRFVIIDGQRLGEDGVMGQQLWAREIVPDGVVIEYNDIRFLLPRLGG